MHGDYGISFEHETGESEELADKYAEDSLIPPMYYKQFVTMGQFDISAIRQFAAQIDRDPGIVVGRLLKDQYVEYSDWTLKPLRTKYKVAIR